MGLFKNIASAMKDASDEGEDVARHVFAQILQHPEIVALGPLGVGPVADAFVAARAATGGEPPLTKEQAMADTMRALKEQFPDRWERIWAAFVRDRAALEAFVRDLAVAADRCRTHNRQISPGYVEKRIELLGAALTTPKP